jgi:glycerophosphoryl diester phosphodiesterase
MTLPLKVPPNFRIIAHRGASAYAPENTAPAFQLAAKMGIREIELDTQLTSDGEVALCHDSTLERYGQGSAVVEEMPWPELVALDMGSWFSPFFFKNERMMTLDQLFEQFGDSFIYHVELKGKAAGLPEATHRCIERHNLAQHCFITSFSDMALASIRAINPDLPLGWLVETINETTLLRAKELNLFQLCPRANQVDRESVDLAHQTVAEVRAWGINGSSLEVLRLIQQVLQAGCDGMTINWPDWVSY